ncbi:MAG: heme-dependent peroxidase [Planctomycetota bacterium]|nr:MAG: heme-dependent peroxidase [Planctomycetota bacterium]
MHPRPQEGPRPEISLVPEEGLHCLHSFYRIDRRVSSAFDAATRAAAKEAFCEILTPGTDGTPERLQTFVVAGHKADFGFLALGPDPLALDGIHQRLSASPLGPALIPAWSFVSLTEVSEYVPTRERYAEMLEAEGLCPKGEEFQQRMAQYERRLEIMIRQRLTPDLPAWPALCFYPMNKRRQAEANWFLLPFDERERLMGEHGRSGMEFAGRVTQLVTVGIGLEDWEWGVTLWARNPQFLRDIVYRMRFDEASARYADFGPFYTAYQQPPGEILAHLRLV